MKTMLYVTELPFITKQLVESGGRRLKAERARVAAADEARAAAAPTGTAPPPLGPQPEEKPTEPPGTAPTGAAAEPRKPGVLYPNEVKNADGSTAYAAPVEPPTGLSAPPEKGPTGWSGSVQDRANQEAAAKAPMSNPGAAKPKPKEEDDPILKAVVGYAGYNLVNSAIGMATSEAGERSEPKGYTGSGMN